MTYAILWISHVGFGLLLVAAVTAVASRGKRLLWRRFWPILTAIFVLIPVVAGGRFGYYILTNNFQPKWLFGYCLSETIISVIGVIIILIRGLKGSISEEQVARLWPRAWLAALTGMAFFVFTTTLNITDMRVMNHLADIKNSATSNIQDMLPAKLPKSLNAHFVYEEARQAFPRQKKDLPYWFDKSENPGFDVSSPEVQAFLSAQHHVLEIMGKAKNIPGYSINVDTSFFVASPIPEYNHYRNIARFVGLYARSIAKEGDILGGLNELAILERMANHLRSFPEMLSFLVASRLENIRYRALEYILAQKPYPPGDLINLLVDARPSVRKDFLTCLRMEAQSTMQAAAVNFLLSDYLDMFNMKSSSKSNYISPTYTAKLFRVFCGPSEIRAVTDIVGYWMSKEADSYEVLKGNRKAISDAEESGKMGFLTLLILPNYSFYIIRAMEYDVHRGLGDLALAVTAYRAVNKTYPAKLQELIPKYIDRIPTDPFDGQPLKMEPVEGGLDLYSIGPGGKDGTIHFYLGREAYERYWVEPEKIKRAQEEEKRKALEKKRKVEAGREIKPRPKKRKKKK